MTTKADNAWHKGDTEDKQTIPMLTENLLGEKGKKQLTDHWKVVAC